MKIPFPLTHYFYHNITHSLIELKEFNFTIEKFLENGRDENNHHFQNEINNFTQGMYDLNLSISFPNLIRSSNLTNIITVTELNLNSLCDSILRQNQNMFTLKDLKANSDFDKFKMILKKVAKIDYSKIEYEWEFVDNCRLIRNKYVHHRGIITSRHGDYNRLTNFINSNPTLFRKYLENEKSYHLKIEKDFIYKLIFTISELVEKIKNQDNYAE